MSGAAAQIVFDRVTKRYPGRGGPAVRELSLTVSAGEKQYVLGQLYRQALIAKGFKVQYKAA